MNPALDPAPAPPAHGEADEQLLHAVRRADWRFLLPDAHLDRVAYAAPHDPALVRALKLVAGRLRLTEADDLQADSADVVVATGAGPQAAARLAAAVRPGGWVYAEARGLASARWAAALRGAGLEEVDVVWLWPDAARTKEMVALSDAHAVRHALGRRDPGARLRVRAWAARALLATGLLRLVVPSVAIVGRRPAGEVA